MGKIPKRRTLSGEIRKNREQTQRQSNSSALFGTGWTVIDDGQILQDGAVTIPANGLLLVDGGDVVMLNEALVEVFRLGLMPNGDRGLTVRRDDGSVVYRMAKPFTPADPQSFIQYDRSGRAIGGDSPLSSSGFDAPHIPLSFTPVDYTSGALAQSTTSATFVATHEHRGLRQNPALRPQLMARCSDGSTAGEIQFYNPLLANYLGGFLNVPAVHTISVPAGTTTFTLFELPSAMALPGDMSDPLHLEIHVRRTAGSGSVSVAPVRTVGSGF